MSCSPRSTASTLTATASWTSPRGGTWSCSTTPSSSSSSWTSAPSAPLLAAAARPRAPLLPAQARKKAPAPLLLRLTRRGGASSCGGHSGTGLRPGATTPRVGCSGARRSSRSGDDFHGERGGNARGGHLDSIPRVGWGRRVAGAGWPRELELELGSVRANNLELELGSLAKSKARARLGSARGDLRISNELKSSARACKSSAIT